jgi:polyisoprenoid-binding protein YceI
MSCKVIFSILAGFALIASPAFAAEKYVIDPDHTSVAFSIQHEQWSKYQGIVREIAGTILFDRENVPASSVHVEMKTSSVDTLNTDRDFEGHGFGFLTEKKTPTMVYDSTAVEKTGDKTGKITGNLTMAGVTHPVLLDVTFNGDGMSNWDAKNRVGFSATGRLSTADFDMHGFANLNIGPELVFTIEVEATKQ